ncbi:MAG: hypothetical protein KAV82_04700 [Phycisphaerae bacterium]|nr:hypothetical protein [Phycisphaerae bacterium]
MKTILALLLIALGLPLAAGCDAVGNILAPDTVTVSLVNGTGYDVGVQLFIYDNQDILEVILTELGSELNYTIPAGETTTFTRDCDDLQAIIIEEAELRVLGSLGPEAGTDVLRDGDDFHCGDHIIFTFTSTDITDLDVAVTVP